MGGGRWNYLGDVWEVVNWSNHLILTIFVKRSIGQNLPEPPKISQTSQSFLEILKILEVLGVLEILKITSVQKFFKNINNNAIFVFFQTYGHFQEKILKNKVPQQIMDSFNDTVLSLLKNTWHFHLQ